MNDSDMIKFEESSKGDYVLDRTLDEYLEAHDIPKGLDTSADTSEIEVKFVAPADPDSTDEVEGEIHVKREDGDSEADALVAAAADEQWVEDGQDPWLRSLVASLSLTDNQLAAIGEVWAAADYPQRGWFIVADTKSALYPLGLIAIVSTDDPPSFIPEVTNNSVIFRPRDIVPGEEKPPIVVEVGEGAFASSTWCTITRIGLLP
jgi:hypothetical protein